MLALACCVAAGPVFTADVLSEEKREGTLGLLFLTDLRAHDVVLGKLAATSVTAVFSLLAVLPVVALSLLLGGVALGEFARVVLVLVNTLGFSLAVGMAVSALCEQARSAFALTSFVLFLATVVAAWWMDGGPVSTPGAVSWVQMVSPVGAWFASAAPQFAADPATFWRALAGAHLVGWGSWAWRRGGRAGPGGKRPPGNCRRPGKCVCGTGGWASGLCGRRCDGGCSTRIRSCGWEAGMRSSATCCGVLWAWRWQSGWRPGCSARCSGGRWG
ncbi:MAG: ABC transporter permease [Verrucomicrobia bacterium]|nr:ABC transporter permease [Verrucomicrobiota bacterium]